MRNVRRAVGLPAVAIFSLSLLIGCTDGAPIFLDPAIYSPNPAYCTPERRANAPFANSGEPDTSPVSPSIGHTICTEAQFAQIQLSGELAATYYLMANLDLATVAYTHLPIGNSTVRFTGKFYGNGHEIRNLSYNGGGSESGLFGYIGVGGVVEHLKVTNSSVTGATNVGLLAGANEGRILRSMTSGSVTGTNLWVGGLAGSNRTGGLIEDSYSTASVTSSDRIVGGLVGLNSSSYIRRCYSTGSVSSSGDGWQGNLLGYGANTGNELSDSFAIGDIINTFPSPMNVRFTAGILSASTTGNLFYSGICTANVVCGSYGISITDPAELYLSSHSVYATWDFVNVWVERAGNFPELR